MVPTAAAAAAAAAAAQVCELLCELESLHAHYQQLLDRLVPRWRHDREGLELTAAPAAARPTATAATAAAAAAGVSASATIATQHQASSQAAPAADTSAAGSASKQQQQTAAKNSGNSSSSSGSSSSCDAVRSMLEGQLETARRDLRSAQHSIARLEGDMAAAADIAASRETSLNTQVSSLSVVPLPSNPPHPNPPHPTPLTDSGATAGEWHCYRCNID
jgi:hypothetical protein